MRDWVGLHTASLSSISDAEHKRRTRDFFADIDYFLRDLSRGVARIQNGEVPDGSGNQIGNNGTLTDYWFKPGTSDPFTAFMGKGAGQGGKISSTADQDKGFINLGDTVYVDEDNGFTGFQVTAPAAAVHIQPGVSGTTTLIPSSSVVHNWDAQNRTGVGGTNAGAFTIASLATSDDYTLYNGVGTLGTNPETVGMSGTITPNRTWTCTFRVACLGATVDNAGDAEFHIVDSTGTKFTKSGLSGLLNGLGTTFTDYTFTLDCSSGSSGSGTANTVIIGLNGKTGLTQQYIACTYFQISTGGDSDIARWNNGSGTLLGKINSLGYLGVNTDSDTLTALFTSESDAAASIVSIFKGATSQSGNLTEWQSQAGSILSRIKSDGTFDGPISTTSAISVLDSQFSILDNADNTKTLKFELGGASANADLTVGYSSTNDRALNWVLAGAAGNDLSLSATLTGDRTITFPDQTGTLPTVNNPASVTGQWTFDTDSNDIIFSSTAGGHSGPATGGLYIKDSASGFSGELAPPTAGFTSDRIITLPDANATLVTETGTQNIGSKTFTITANVARCNTASSGWAFADNGTTSKVLRLIMSGAFSGNNTFTLTGATEVKAYTFMDTSGSVVVVGNDPPAVAAGALGKVDATGLAAATGSTNLTNGARVGVYEIHYEMTCTTGDVTAGTLTFDAIATGDQGAQTISSAALPLTTATASATNPARGTIVRYLASGELAYTTTVTGAFNNARAALRVRVCYLG